MSRSASFRSVKTAMKKPVNMMLNDKHLRCRSDARNKPVTGKV